jgi:hypothetical protein
MSLRFRGVNAERTGDKGHNAPQSPYDASEAAEQHRRCNVNCLVRGVPIALCCLARTEIRNRGLWKFELHEVLDRELSIVQHDRTIEWICILYAMAGQMKNMGWYVLEQ